MPLTGKALGDIHVTVTESKGNTVISWQGTLDVSGLNPSGTSPVPEGAIFPKLGVLAGAGNKQVDVYLFRTLQTRSFGKGKGVLATGSLGDPLLISNTLECNELCLCLPSGYQGEVIRGELSFAGVSLESLEIDTTPFSYDLGGQYVHFFASQEKESSPRVAVSHLMPRERPAKKTEKKLFPRQRMNLVLSPVFAAGRVGEVPSVAVRPIGAGNP